MTHFHMNAWTPDETALPKVFKIKLVDAGADGIVFQNIRFCDLHGSENGLLERIFEKAGVPCLRLEREYGPLAEAGRLRMRLDAFMERLDRKGRHEA